VRSLVIWDHTVLPATRQRWFSRLYPGTLPVFIYCPRKDERLSWVAGYTKTVYPQTFTHPSISRARRTVTPLIETHARYTVVSRMVTFPGWFFFPGKTFPGKSFPDGHFPRIGRFPGRRFPDGHFPGKSFPGWSFSRMTMRRFPERLREW